jgi:hypothetical protein
MKKTLLFLLLPGFLMAQSYNVSIAKHSNYNSWGTAWDSAIVLTNNLTTLAVVPVIGGRIMQYKLGTHDFMYLNEAIKGTTSDSGGQMWGGMRQLASPQSDFTGGFWPPPPTLDSKAYTAAITANSVDSCSVYLQSGIEASYGTNFNGLQFKRTVTLYKNSSHARIKMTMVNADSAARRNHGVWDITEVKGGTSGITYDTMICAYVPLNPASTMGAGRGYAQLQTSDTTQWIKNAATGVLGIQYRHVEAKMGADSKVGWVCNVDSRNGYAYAKLFSYVSGGIYPDSGSSVEVYTYGSSYSCMEMEIMGPMVTLENGDSITLVEDWYAARSNGPVYSVNNAGLVTRPLTVQQTQDTVRVHGVYGIFYQGTVKPVFTNATGAFVAAADSYSVTPTDSFVLNDTLKVPSGASRLFLAAYNIDGAFVGNLDSVSVTPITTSCTKAQDVFPFDGSPLSVTHNAAGLCINVNGRGYCSIDIYMVNGRRIASFSGRSPRMFYCQTDKMHSGLLFVKTRIADREWLNEVFFAGNNR